MTGSKGSDARLAAMTTASSREPREFDVPRDAQGRIRVSAEYGVKTFDLRKMREKLPTSTYERLVACVEKQEKLDKSVAAAVAHAAKEWAIENGATHFCHWFQPLTGLTAEKHDAFLTTMFGSDPIETFGASQLVQSEPDASSFPSGGMRSTFEARGYTAWDPASPMFLMGNGNHATLCIPSAYLSWYGHALDEKTGLLRSMEALYKAVKKLLATIGEAPVKRVTATVGSEQEYFLVDRAFMPLRPDLVVAGRTLVGAAPPKGQQLEDHYFGSIPARVGAFMSDFEHELYQLAVPCKTRHNEVAPAQFETAPIFEEAHLSADHNQLTMEVMRRVARRHNFEVLFHEKPFAGINGSGKHLNWSVATQRDDGRWSNLLDPGEAPEHDLRFLVTTACVLRAVHRNAGVLRAAISGAGNDHRLGANEAPPAIISVFLGKSLSDIFDRLAQGLAREGGAREKVLSLGVSHLPEVQRDPTDRNRTSPFAFTGNKFEFRACGASMAISFPITCLNAAVADSVADTEAEIKKSVDTGASIEAAVLDVVQAIARETAAIRFEGDGYSQEWQQEAERRGLPNLRKTPEALEWLADPKNHRFLVKQGVFSPEEVMARVHVRTERYVKDIDIEYQSLLKLVDTSIVPAAAGFLGAMCESVAATKAVGIDAPQAARTREFGKAVADLETSRDKLLEVRQALDAIHDEKERGRRYASDLVPALQRVRAASDRVENLCGDAWWPLPRYHEMLFIR
jgi:glutamine synthetase